METQEKLLASASAVLWMNSGQNICLFVNTVFQINKGERVTWLAVAGVALQGQLVSRDVADFWQPNHSREENSVSVRQPEAIYEEYENILLHATERPLIVQTSY